MALQPRPALYFYAAEVDVYQPATAVQAYALGRGSHPRAALTMFAAIISSSDTLRASDVGYRTLSTDAGGVVVYPPLLDQAFEIDRHVALDPGTASTATFGAIRLNNLGQRYDAYTATRNSDSRAARILAGLKTWDTGRGVYVDPPKASLAPLFGGNALPWVLDEAELTIPLRDATYLIDRPLQTTLYTGAGSYGGGADLTGRALPMTRGGTAGNPVLNVSLILVDAANLIYQWSDGPGTLVTLYEGGAAVFTADADVANLYAGTTPGAGHYRTNNARSLVQMGSKPVNTLTGDVTGAFPVAGVVTTAATLARYVIGETMGQAASLDLASFTAADTAYPYVAGFFVGTSDVTALSVVQTLLGSIGARLIASRAGLLGAFVLRSLPIGATPALALTTANVIGVTPTPLPATVDPPPSTWRVGYQPNNTLQTSGLNVTVTAARTGTLAQTQKLAAWFGSSVATAYRNASKPEPVVTYLLNLAQAQVLANDFGALFDDRPGLFAVELAVDVAAGLNLGSVVSLKWPLANLGSGQLGQIVGEQIRSSDASVTFSVLVA